MVLESPRGDKKKGDLAVTVIAARNLRSDGKTDTAYCVVELSDNKPVRTHLVKDKKEPIWNETFNLDLFSLDAAEVLISVYAKRRITSDKFMGQIQVPIKALSIAKDEQWYFLTDKPSQSTLDTPKTPKGLKKGGSIRSKKTVTKSDDEAQPTFVSGELCVRLQFIHRLMRGKSRALLIGGTDTADMLKPPVSSSPSTPTSPISARTVSFIDTKKPDLSVGGTLTSNLAHATDDPTLSKDEAIIIDNALREKQRLVMQRLEEKRELVRILNEKVAALKSQPDNPQYEVEHNKLQEMQNELRELEKLEQEVMGLLDSQKIRKEGQNRDKRGSFVRITGANGNGINQSKRQSIKIDARRLTNRFTSVPRLDLPMSDDRYDTDDVKILKMRIRMLESDLENERKLSEMANSKILLLEKENKRLESEVGLRGRSTSLANEKFDIFHIERAMELDTVVKIQDEINEATKESKEALELRRKDAEEKLKEVELDIEENVLKQKRIEVELMERRVQHRQGFLSKIQGKSRKAQFKLDEDEEDFIGSSDDSGDYDGSADMSEPSSRRSKSPKLMPEPSTDRFEMLVGKLEKLDKLDEVLRKIEAMKYISVGDNSGLGASASGRSYSDLKQELEELQKIICDETGKYQEKEKEDANIKYEKTFGELSQTSEFKMEQAQALEEKRKLNEPLNKEALDRMLKIYTPDATKNDPVIKDKINKNPELILIGMDPKAILAKHQNDFSQYLLRLSDIDDLRAIRASLPKFRNDQKRQLEWVEILESKIEQVAKAPVKKAPPPKPTLPKWKPKAPPKGAKPTDMFAELLAKKNKNNAGGAVEEPPEKPKEATISKIKLAPMKPSAVNLFSPIPTNGPPPPPPPPPSLQF